LLIDLGEARGAGAEGPSFTRSPVPGVTDAAGFRRPRLTGTATISSVPSRRAHILGHEEVLVCYAARSRVFSLRSPWLALPSRSGSPVNSRGIRESSWRLRLAPGRS